MRSLCKEVAAFTQQSIYNVALQVLSLRTSWTEQHVRLLNLGWRWQEKN